jgi:hypothetical protein
MTGQLGVMRRRGAQTRLAAAGALVLALIACDAQAYTKAERCDAYARDATARTPTSTGVGRGAARGAVVGAVAGNAGAGAATGAVVGTARKANQKHKSYQYYYDSCMRS